MGGHIIYEYIFINLHHYFYLGSCKMMNGTDGITSISHTLDKVSHTHTHCVRLQV